MSRTALLAAAGLTLAGSLPAAAQNLVIFPSDRPAAESTEGFRAEALRSDAYNIEASRLALQKSNNRAVRDYAEQTIVNRQATTDALLPRGTSLSPAGTVVGDAGAGNILTAPLALATAPIAVVGNVLQGRPITDVKIVDTDPATQGRRVALDPVRQQRLARLQAAPGGKRFDALYTADQARAQGDTVQLYETYSRFGDSNAGRTFANEAKPMLRGDAGEADRLADRYSDDDSLF
jgi:predicted outer membrane protein